MQCLQKVLMYDQEFKIKKWNVWTGCIAWFIGTVIALYVLFGLFRINFLDQEKPWLVLKQSVRFKSPGFYVPYSDSPLLALLLVLSIFFFLFKAFIEYFMLARKGYVVLLNEKGLILPSGRFVSWNSIEKIEAIEAVYRQPEKIIITLKEMPTRNPVMKLFKAMSKEKIVLTQFEKPLEEAHQIITSYCNQYH